MAEQTLPPFPVDDVTLNAVEHALGTCLGEGNAPVGGEFTLPTLLDFLSGYDPNNVAVLEDGLFDGDEPRMIEYLGTIYSEHDLIRALVAEVRRLRQGVS